MVESERERRIIHIYVAGNGHDQTTISNKVKSINFSFFSVCVFAVVVYSFIMFCLFNYP